MITWHRAKDKQPSDNQSCFITTQGSSSILGPIIYKEKERFFLDLFATPEAGACYSVDETDYDLYWCEEGEMNKP